MKLLGRSLVLFIFLAGINFAQAQNPCSEPERKQFDFWIGDWELTWTGQDGITYKGENSINYIFDGCVVEENFNDPNSGFEGISHSVYVPSEKVWKQTWVSNAGGYLDFIGKYEDDKMILSRKFTNADGKEIHQRMVWYNIEEDSLEWNWEKSTDGGENWQLSWHIQYKRK